MACYRLDSGEELPGLGLEHRDGVLGPREGPHRVQPLHNRAIIPFIPSRNGHHASDWSNLGKHRTADAGLPDVDDLHHLDAWQAQERATPLPDPGGAIAQHAHGAHGRVPRDFQELLGSTAVTWLVRGTARASSSSTPSARAPIKRGAVLSEAVRMKVMPHRSACSRAPISMS